MPKTLSKLAAVATVSALLLSACVVPPRGPGPAPLPIPAPVPLPPLAPLVPVPAPHHSP